jgi:hypothetical protein
MNNIQMLPTWHTHTPNDGSQIGGKQPDEWGWWAGPPIGRTAALLHVKGPEYATVEAYVLLPRIISPTLRMSFDLTADADSLAALGLIETDLKRFDGTFEQNYSMQRFFAKGLEVSDVRGGWREDAAIQTAPLVPGATSHHEIYYATETTGTGKYGTQAIVIDGQMRLVPPQLQGLTPQPSTWTAGELIQIQITGRPGLAQMRACIIIDNLALEAV